MPFHVAILLRRYIKLLLTGRKTVESRLTKSPRAPFGLIEAGQRVFFKASSGPFMATAVAHEVASFDDLSPRRVTELQRQFNDAVCGDDDYWAMRRDCRYATFVSLREVQPVSRGPTLAPSRGPAWFCLDGESPAPPDVPACFEVTLTAGAIRNQYLRIGRRTHTFAAKHYGGETGGEPGAPITLELPGGEQLVTDLTPTGMLRRRGLGGLFAAHRVSPGDRARFVEIATGRYRVTFHPPLPSLV